MPVSRKRFPGATSADVRVGKSNLSFTIWKSEPCSSAEEDALVAALRDEKLAEMRDRARKRKRRDDGSVGDASPGGDFGRFIDAAR